MDISERLMILKKKKEEATNSKAVIEGKIASNMERLKTELGCKTLGEAQKEISTLEPKILKMEQALLKTLDELEAKI